MFTECLASSPSSRRTPSPFLSLPDCKYIHFSLLIFHFRFSFLTFTFSSSPHLYHVHLYMTASIQQQLAITTDFISLSIFMSLSLVLNQGSQEHHFQNSFEQNKSFLERLFVSERVHSSTKLNVPGNLLTILSQSRSP